MIIAEGYEWTVNEDGSYTTVRPYVFGRNVTAHALPVARTPTGYEPLGDYGDKWTLYEALHPRMVGVKTFRILGKDCVFYIV